MLPIENLLQFRDVLTETVQFEGQFGTRRNRSILVLGIDDGRNEGAKRDCMDCRKDQQPMSSLKAHTITSWFIENSHSCSGNRI